MDTKLDYESTFCIPERASSLPNKLLVGAGPTNLSPRVIAALQNSTSGTCCPELYQMMDDIVITTRYLFQTDNDISLALQSSGTGGIEAAVCNVVDPGEKVIVAVGGKWGERVVEKAKSRGAEVVVLKQPSPEVFALEELEKQLIEHKPSVLFITHGETSTGVLQNLDGLGRICHKHTCLLVVDAVVTVGGVPFYADRWEIDVAIAGSQKAVGAPTGLALITMSPRAVNRMRHLKHAPPFYFNILRMSKMWGLIGPRERYYITYNSHMLSALREALIEIVEEGLINRWERHRTCAERFWADIDRLGMEVFISKRASRLSIVNCYTLSPDVNQMELVKYLEDRYRVTIGYGNDKQTLHTVRMGFMGHNARPEVVDYVLKVLEEAINYLRSQSSNSKGNGLV